jgi:hypothetical protein
MTSIGISLFYFSVSYISSLSSFLSIMHKQIFCAATRNEHWSAIRIFFTILVLCFTVLTRHLCIKPEHRG